eukprot:gene4891-5531_t
MATSEKIFIMVKIELVVASLWGMQRGTLVPPKSTNFKRMEQNIKSTEIKLDADYVMKIDNITQGTRYIDQKWAAPKGMSIEEFWDGEYLS